MKPTPGTFAAPGKQALAYRQNRGMMRPAFPGGIGEPPEGRPATGTRGRERKGHGGHDYPPAAAS